MPWSIFCHPAGFKGRTMQCQGFGLQLLFCIKHVTTRCGKLSSSYQLCMVRMVTHAQSLVCKHNNNCNIHHNNTNMMTVIVMVNTIAIVVRISMNTPQNHIYIYIYIYIHICTHTHICLYTHPHMCMYIIHTNIYRFQFLARPWRHLQWHLSSGAMLRSCHVFFFWNTFEVSNA